MVAFKKVWIGGGAALVLMGVLGAQTAANGQSPSQRGADESASTLQQDANKKLVESYYRPGITIDERMALMTPDYVQHNPQYQLFAKINHVHGRDGFKLMLEIGANLRPAANTHGPKPPPGKALFKVIADGNLVTVIHQRYVLQPGTKDSFYPVYGFVTYRVQDGKLSEDWDDGTLPEVLPDYLREPVSQLKSPAHAAAGN